VAHLSLADAMYPTKPLLDAVGVPWQVVVDQVVRPLEVDAFSSGIGSDQDRAVLVLGKALLNNAPFLAGESAVDRHHCLGFAKVATMIT
jgi:hypothetical protein